MKLLVILTLGISLVFGIVDINNASKKELNNLSGIGKKTVEKNKANLTASKCKK